MKTIHDHASFVVRVSGLFFALIAPFAHAQVATYGFDDLAAGPLGGQDNWSTQVFTTSAPAIAPGSGINGTQVLTNGLTANGAGTRVNDGNFAFPQFTGNETDAFIQFDFSNVTGNESNGQAIFYFGHDADVNGWLDADESMSMRYDTGTFNFYYPIGGAGQFRSVLGAGAATDWYRLRLVMNFQTGNGVFEYQNLTRGDANFSQITYGNLALGSLDPLAGPTTWDTAWVVGQFGIEIDNLSVGLTTAAIPEPSTYALIAGSLTLAYGVFRRRRAVGV